jgi:hypothetical protein
MVLDVPVRKFVNMVGHDGSTKPYSERPEQEAGFHIQECIEVAQKLGYACTPIEIVPQMIPAPECLIPRPVWFPLYSGSEETNWRRFCRHLEGTFGIITGLKKRINGSEIGHAVAWSGKIYDSQGRGLVYSLAKASNYGFTPRVYWKIQRILNA